MKSVSLKKIRYFFYIRTLFKIKIRHLRRPIERRNLKNHSKLTIQIFGNYLKQAKKRFSIYKIIFHLENWNIHASMACSSLSANKHFMTPSIITTQKPFDCSFNVSYEQRFHFWSTRNLSPSTKKHDKVKGFSAQVIFEWDLTLKLKLVWMQFVHFILLGCDA